MTTERIIADGIKVYCSHDKVVDIDSLIPNPKNPNTHPKTQIKLLSKIIKNQGWRQAITVSNQSGFIVKGHGRLESAKLLGVTEVPVDFQNYPNQASEYADMMADNKLAELSDVDMALVNDLINDESFADFDVTLTGFDKIKIDDIDEGDDDKYTKKIEAPTYEPTNEKPKSEALIDLSVTERLLKEIQDADISEEDKKFLTLASHRHTKFHYNTIADYYAHATPQVQDLMEKSALVIIDFDKAIANGFVRLGEKIKEQYDEEYT